ncbi:Aldo/keto reductase [Rickenella mellea]|uniref:Aldo/keto reductase n=1 Tax=Rickenella mellea TaxID=50990 RepID=A0A4Y7Q2S1_9AGAM|nr:Aldo/keto reductase [Rickenella mellea]
MSSDSPKTNIEVVLGTMTFGAPRENALTNARVTDLRDVSDILDEFQKHGHSKVDTAALYCDGTSEEYLGELNWAQRGLDVHTKLYPIRGINHTAEGIREYYGRSLKSLKADKLDLFYLHGPDRNTPWEVTFKACDDLHKEGKFNKLGLSNYAAWEVAEIVMLCRANGWIQPTVYQGLYNAIHRGVEAELIPCIRRFGLSFYGYSPLAGGFFTGRYANREGGVESGSRFDLNSGSAISSTFRARYWNDQYFRALEIVNEAAKKHNLTLPEIAMRWETHHSVLKREFGDAIIIGGSSLKNIRENLVDLEKGPLPADVVEAVDEAWGVVSGNVAKYFH